MIEALYNAVVVQPIELEETTYGNIVVPDLGNEKNKTAKVISIGPGAPSVMGSILPTTLKKCPFLRNVIYESSIRVFPCKTNAPKNTQKSLKDPKKALHSLYNSGLIAILGQ